MAASLGYGVLFATGIVLLLIPALYLVLDDVKGLLARRRPAESEGAGVVGQES